MPVEGPPKPHPHIETMTTIPTGMRAAITAATGYSGPWTVSRLMAADILTDYEASQEDVAGGADQDIVDLLNAVGSLLSGGGSGGGSGAQGLSAKQKANLRNSYLSYLDQLGIELTKNLQNLMDQGINQEWSTTSFLVHLRQTKEYKVQFPGINTVDGMSEAQYNSEYRAYQDLAESAGYSLSREQFNVLLKKHIPIREWNIRLEFQKRVARDPKFFKQLEVVARSRGIIGPKEQLSRKDLFDLMTRRGNPALEKLMEEANVRYLLRSIKFTIGPEGDVSRKQLLTFIQGIEGQGGDAESLTGQDFARLAETVRTVLPASRQMSAGLTKRDMFVLEFGGPGQNEIARRAKAVLESVATEDERRVKSVLVQDEDGTRLLSGTPIRPTGL
jgi:hypothetical protein